MLKYNELNDFLIGTLQIYVLVFEFSYLRPLSHHRVFPRLSRFVRTCFRTEQRKRNYVLIALYFIQGCSS